MPLLQTPVEPLGRDQYEKSECAGGRPSLSFLDSGIRSKQKKIEHVIKTSSPNLLKAVSLKKISLEHPGFDKISKNLDDFIDLSIFIAKRIYILIKNY